MYAMSNFQSAGNARLQSKIEDAIKANLGRIGELKDTISKLETENDELAK